MNHTIFPAIIIPIFLFSCRQSPAPVEIQQELASSGNHAQLEEALEHYAKDPSDSLKYKAAVYYIRNIEGFHYYEGSLLDHYTEYYKLINADRDHGEYYLKSFNALYGPFLSTGVEKKYDIRQIKASQLEDNIDMAFKVWKEQPWGKDLSFDDFCEYILPFRIMNEFPEYNRREIYGQFHAYLDSVVKAGGSAEDACSVINKVLSRPQWIFSLRVPFLPHFRASELIKYHVGSCREMTDLAFFTMRAVGIPVAIDFIPQWPYRSMGHEFNAVLGRNGKMIMFLGAEDNPGTPHKPLTRKGKIYRHTFAKNPLSLAMIKDDTDKVPLFLADPRIRDVTDEYVPCMDITVPLMDCPSLSERNKKYAYIAVFDNNEWVPVQWGIPRGDHVLFTKMEGGIVYMAGYYDRSKMVPANYPFILTEKGEIKYFQPDKENVNKTICLSRVFPLVPDAFDTWHMDGCRFQGANSPDFHDATDLYTIPVRPNPFWNEIQLNIPQSFRYVRYIGIGYTHMGEMEFYSSGKIVKGKPSGTATAWYRDRTFDKAVDGDINTYFDPSGSTGDSTWIALDLGKKERLDKIRFSAPLQEEKVAIVAGHNYQLFYWDHGAWFPAGTQTATTKEIVFGDIPSKALYYIRDLTEPVNCRIFSYTGDKPVWW